MSARSRLSPFNPEATCPKCKFDKVASYYMPPIKDDPCWYDRKYNPPDKWPEKEFIRRTCERCRYDWPESATP